MAELKSTWLAAVVIGLIVWPVSGRPAHVHECDRLAAHPTDQQRRVPGVWWDWLDAERALAACERALEEYPGVARFRFQYARALHKSGDREKASALYRELAQNGYLPAQVSVGMLYEYAVGVQRDYTEAARWYRMAAENNSVGGQLALGLLYHFGDGVPQSNEQAIHWLSKAAEQGAGIAHSTLCELSGNLTEHKLRTLVILALLVVTVAAAFIWQFREPDSYVSRHWRGDHPLSRSFWTNCVLVYLVFGGINLQLYTTDTITQPTGTLIYAAFFLLSVIILPWQVVGCWRAASLGTRTTSLVLWPWTIKIVLIAGIIGVANRLSVLNENYTWASKVEQYGYEISVLSGGRELEICGVLVTGIAEEIEKRLKNLPDLEVVHVNSSGGWYQEALKILDMIEKRELTTYSEAGCESACAAILLGGRERVLNENARVGFHASSFLNTRPETHMGEYDISVRKFDQEVYATHGVDADFVTRISETSPDKMWYPPVDELLRAGVITRVSDGREFASFTDRR